MECLIWKLIKAWPNMEADTNGIWKSSIPEMDSIIWKSDPTLSSAMGCVLYLASLPPDPVRASP